MKNLILCVFIFLFTGISWAQRMGIGTTTPAASALVDMTSTSQGLLPPRMSNAERNEMSGPVAGMIIWCTNCTLEGEMQVFNGYAWKNMADSLSPSGIVTICNQVWTTKNLDVARFRNGEPIPKVTDPAAWAALTTAAYCYYNNDSSTYAAIYGKLYNWYAVNDSRGLAPAGWHVASDAEWTTIETCQGGSSVAGGAMKEAGTIHWTIPNTGATNSSGFTGLPGGLRQSSGAFLGGGGIYNYLWSSSEILASSAWYRFLSFSFADIGRNATLKQTGFSVRCIRD